MGAFNTWLISNLMWEALKASSSGVLRSATRARPVKGWAESLNDKFSGEFRVLRETCREPVIHSDGEYPLTDALKKEARRLAKINSKKDRPNDQHGILSRQPNWLSDPVNLHIQSLDFGAVSALRAVGQRPEILSASAVIVCSARRQVLLQSRARDLATYPGCIHTVGDAYIPPGFGTVDSDRGGLVSTLTREVNEETQLGLSMESLPNLMIQRIDDGVYSTRVLGSGHGSVRDGQDNRELGGNTGMHFLR